jgi:hypothetical protein
MLQQIPSISAADYVHARMEQSAAKARSQFFAFRQRLRPTMLWDWWVELLCMELQQFYEDLRAGLRPRLAVMAIAEGQSACDRSLSGGAVLIGGHVTTY